MKSLLGIFVLLFYTNLVGQDLRPNVLLIVADDLGYDSPGFAGGVAPNVTPNIDQLATESVSFEKAFSMVSVCQPSRQSMLTGLIPHHYGSKGFFPMAVGTVTLPALLRDAGYLTGVIHKVGHMAPFEDFNWNYTHRELGAKGPEGVIGRDPSVIAKVFQKLIEIADNDKKPFFMVVNSADPHRPFHGSYNRSEGNYKPREPSRIYKPNEVTIPPTLPDLPEIRKDLAQYASSVRRLDDTVGECLKTLENSNKSSTTIVIFVSDNGMPLPFGKFDSYLSSNRSPLLIKLPKEISEPRVDDEHLISLIDITPTILELTNLSIPANLDGKSFVPLLKERNDSSWRQSIVFLRNEDIYYSGSVKRRAKKDPEGFREELKTLGWVARLDHHSKGTLSRSKEIRTYFDGQFGYIYNHCYNPSALEKSDLGLIVPYDDTSSKAMKEASKEDPEIKKRYESYLLRSQEELYNWKSDFGSHYNLSKDSNYRKILEQSRNGLQEWMEKHDDPLTEAFKESQKNLKY